VQLVPEIAAINADEVVMLLRLLQTNELPVFTTELTE